MYEFARGPLIWIAFIVFICGSIYQVRKIALMAKKDKVVYPYLDLRSSVRSIVHWLMPYSTVNMRLRPAFSLLSGLFHICLLITPIFLTGHIISWEESWGISWWRLPESVTNVMTILVLLIGAFFFLRRIADPTVRYVTAASDFVVLAVVLSPFFTGLLAYYQVFNYETMITLHIWTGALWLMAIPFSRLKHMLFFPMTRAYMGSEFGFRGSKDW